MRATEQCVSASGSSSPSTIWRGNSTTCTKTATELNNLAAGDRDRVRNMTRLYEEWAAKCQVVPWPANPRTLRGRYRTLGLHNYIA